MATVAPEVKEAIDLGKSNQKSLGDLNKKLDGLVEKLSKTPANMGQHPWQQGFAPHARVGEDPMSSRGFKFLKMLGLLTQGCTREQAKHEHDVHERLCKAYEQNGFVWGGAGRTGETRFLAPLATGFMEEGIIPTEFRTEMKSMVIHGSDGSMDLPDEMRWVRSKMFEKMGYSGKALSWLNELTGGSLVAPPEQGELIELLRNKEALINAGARTVPLPAQGRLKFPRQTAASNTYWVGENSPIPDSNIGTGEITLQAKKLAVMIIAPNELIRFASPAAEALMRDDMTKSLALGLDLAGLEGQGTDTRPRGVINYQNINRITSTAPTTNGDALVANDIYRMIAAVEESNAEFEGFIMRPKTLYKYYQLRADAVAQGDKQGVFLFNLIREAGEGCKPMLAGSPVTKSTQVSQSRSKGSATNLTYIVGGMWSDCLIGMFGAIEFAATTQGDTSFRNDQTWVRGILSADIQLRHEAAFVLMDNLDVGPAA
jgi:HK97 family phage major capsid protein